MATSTGPSQSGATGSVANSPLDNWPARGRVLMIDGFNDVAASIAGAAHTVDVYNRVTSRTNNTGLWNAGTGQVVGSNGDLAVPAGGGLGWADPYIVTGIGKHIHCECWNLTPTPSAASAGVTIRNNGTDLYAVQLVTQVATLGNPRIEIWEYNAAAYNLRAFSGLTDTLINKPFSLHVDNDPAGLRASVSTGQSAYYASSTLYSSGNGCGLYTEYGVTDARFDLFEVHS